MLGPHPWSDIARRIGSFLNPGHLLSLRRFLKSGLTQHDGEKLGKSNIVLVGLILGMAIAFRFLWLAVD